MVDIGHFEKIDKSPYFSNGLMDRHGISQDDSCTSEHYVPLEIRTFKQDGGRPPP